MRDRSGAGAPEIRGHEFRTAKFRRRWRHVVITGENNVIDKPEEATKIMMSIASTVYRSLVSRSQICGTG